MLGERGLYTSKPYGYAMICRALSTCMSWLFFQFIKAFRKMQAELEKGKHSLDWRTNRETGKIERLSLTDTIKDFVEYATSQGSKSAKMYYMNITKMEYKALELIEKADKQIGGSFRDTLSCTELGHLITAESIAGCDGQRNGSKNALQRHLPARKT